MVIGGAYRNGGSCLVRHGTLIATASPGGRDEKKGAQSQCTHNSGILRAGLTIYPSPQDRVTSGGSLRSSRAVSLELSVRQQGVAGTFVNYSATISSKVRRAVSLGEHPPPDPIRWPSCLRDAQAPPDHCAESNSGNGCGRTPSHAQQFSQSRQSQLWPAGRPSQIDAVRAGDRRALLATGRKVVRIDDP